MVSPISARLLAGTRDDSPLSMRLLQRRNGGDASSQGSSSKDGRSHSSCSSSLRQKRTASGGLKSAVASGNENKVASSVSGYSADKEEGSVHPPVVSIALHGRDDNVHNSKHRNAIHCPKRQKINELQFAATTAKDDLDRAGMEYRKLNRDMEEVHGPGSNNDANMRIRLKGVRLMHSREVSGPLISSNVSEKSTVSDYVDLLHAVADSYPAPSSLDIKSLEQARTSRDGSSSASTSSVSDTESDSGSDNVQNQQLFFLPPRVEDSLEASKIRKVVSPVGSPCNVISTASNAITMTESIQLSKDPRIITLSTTPYSIIHANAAFMRLSGKDGSSSVLGTSFLNLLDPTANALGGNVNLTNCMVSSSRGEDSKMYLLPKESTTTTPSSSSSAQDPVECSVRVSPIVEKKTQNREVTAVSHFAIELFESLRNGSHHSAASISLGPIIDDDPTNDLCIGVMG